jgi:Contractile injection system tube protein/LysM domain
MPDPTGFQKARLDIEGGQRLECWLNPTQYAIAKANDWSARPIVGASLPAAQFGGGHARELTLELLFDASPDGDVSAATDTLFKVMEVDAALAGGASRRNQARPPSLTLSWGAFTSFKAVCRQLNVQFLLFRPDGAPVRALAGMTLLQVEKDAKSGGGTPAAPQNPTTRADRVARSHVVRHGDTLPSLAFQYLGDATRWRAIAHANEIDDPRRLTPGAALTIPA